MNETQRVTLEWLLKSNLQGDELLLEALLRRGFLVFQDTEGVWLGTGSHSSDIAILRTVNGIDVKPVVRRQGKAAAICIQSAACNRIHAIAASIIAIPENHVGESMGHWTTVGVAPGINETWMKYRRMIWGAKLPVCPKQVAIDRSVCGALDLGIALLVKALPLARVATSLSCDGHGVRPATINLHFQWDSLWGEAVFQTLRVESANSKWVWEDRCLTIHPKATFNDDEVLGMLNDIQHIARRLLTHEVIAKLGVAKVRTIESFGYQQAPVEAFSKVARRELNMAFIH